METRMCAADDCKKDFVPKVEWEKFCSIRCKNRTHVRIFRARRRHRIPDSPPPGPGGPDGGLHATIGGAVEYQPGGVISDKNRYSVKSERKPVVPASVSDDFLPGGLRDAA